MQMCGRVIFGSAENHFFDLLSAASRVLGLRSLLPYALTLYYIALEYQALKSGSREIDLEQKRSEIT
jgi:hypothetical protein